MNDDSAPAIHDPGGVGFRIETLWAYLAVHEDNNEGVIAVTMGQLFMPLVVAQERLAREYRKHARAAARAAVKPVQLVRFDTRTDVETIMP